MQEIIAYIHLHPLRIIAGIVAVFALLITLFFLQKKGLKKWLTLLAIIGFIPLAFRIVKITPVRKIRLFESVSTYENTEKSSFKENGIRTFGLDISHHQGYIEWDSVATSEHPIQFIFIRATNGTRILDREFHRNWEESRGKSFLRGVYHYYRPNENSTEQFNHFNSVYSYKKGDLPPVLDIEEMGKNGEENLRKGLLNFLQLIEKNWGIKPIIYSGRTFYFSYIKDYFNNYPLWIAAYSGEQRVNLIHWEFYQFTEQLQIKGIQSAVDGNYYKGNLQDLKKMCR